MGIPLPLLFLESIKDLLPADRFYAISPKCSVKFCVFMIKLLGKAVDCITRLAFNFRGPSLIWNCFIHHLCFCCMLIAAFTGTPART